MRRVKKRVDLETAKARALACLDRQRPYAASFVANYIWPGHDMTGQGAGGAASRILRVLQQEGKAAPLDWGWIRTVGPWLQEPPPAVYRERKGAAAQ